MFLTIYHLNKIQHVLLTKCMNMDSQVMYVEHPLHLVVMSKYRKPLLSLMATHSQCRLTSVNLTLLKSKGVQNSYVWF